MGPPGRQLAPRQGQDRYLRGPRASPRGDVRGSRRRHPTPDAGGFPRACREPPGRERQQPQADRPGIPQLPSAKNAFPAQVLYGGKTGKVPYSWRVAILPYIEQQELYKAYNFDEPWDGPNNRKLIDKMPAIYGYPGQDGTPASRSKTSYFAFTGPRRHCIPAPRPGREAELVEPSNPAVHRRELEYDPGRRGEHDIPWTKPEDIPFDPNGPLPELGGYWENGFNAASPTGRSTSSRNRSSRPS